MDNRDSLVERLRTRAAGIRDIFCDGDGSYALANGNDADLLDEAASALQPPAADVDLMQAVSLEIARGYSKWLKGVSMDGIARKIISTLRSQQSKEIERLREALGEIAKDSNPDWTEYRVYSADVLDDVHKIAVDALYNRTALAQGAGGMSERCGFQFSIVPCVPMQQRRRIRSHRSRGALFLTGPFL